MTVSTEPKRRWLRFSLRSLMLLVLVLAVALGWAVHKARQQGIAVSALKEMGCIVRFREGDPDTLAEF